MGTLPSTVSTGGGRSGIGPASGILQSIVRRVFADFEDWIIVIFDNFSMLASDYTDVTMKLQKVLTSCRDNGLVLKMKKSWIGTTNVTYGVFSTRKTSKN